MAGLPFALSVIPRRACARPHRPAAGDTSPWPDRGRASRSGAGPAPLLRRAPARFAHHLVQAGKLHRIAMGDGDSRRRPRLHRATPAIALHDLTGRRTERGPLPSACRLAPQAGLSPPDGSPRPLRRGSPDRGAPAVTLPWHPRTDRPAQAAAETRRLPALLRHSGAGPDRQARHRPTPAARMARAHSGTSRHRPRHPATGRPPDPAARHLWSCLDR